MTYGELAQQFMENVVQIGSRGQRIEKLLVLLFAVGRIDAVQIWIVEIAALDAPHFVIHLFPFGHRVDVHFHVGQLESTLAWLERRRGRHDDILRRTRCLCTTAATSYGSR